MVAELATDAIAACSIAQDDTVILTRHGSNDSKINDTVALSYCSTSSRLSLVTYTTGEDSQEGLSADVHVWRMLLFMVFSGASGAHVEGSPSVLRIVFGLYWHQRRQVRDANLLPYDVVVWPEAN